MRLLHTSDWHLGVSIGEASCEEEQRAFLDWLVDEMRDRDTDVLVVSGDVFHYPSPSNTAAQMYYDFLVDCAGLASLQKVVIVAGNHDSPTGLEAPKRILQTLDVEVVGRVASEPEERDSLVPVRDDDGELLGVVAAVPYVTDATLGVTMRGSSPDERYRDYVDAFEALYADLADRAAERWPDAPLVATGHLTCYGSSETGDADDFDTAIHGCVPEGAGQSVGTIEPLRPTMFDAHFDYAALGHIHRPKQVGDSVAHYSGTPVPTKEGESKPVEPGDESGRYVLDVRFDESNERASDPEVEWIEVPSWRRVETVAGDLDEVVERLESLDWDQPLPPYVALEVDVGHDDHNPSEIDPTLHDLFDERFDDGDRPRILERLVVDTSGGTGDAWEAPDPSDLEPVEVFRRKYERERGDDAEPDEDLLSAFHDLEREIREEDRTE